MNKNELRLRFERALKEAATNSQLPKEKLIWVKGATYPEPFGITMSPRVRGQRILFISAGNFEGNLWQLWYIPDDADMTLINENLPVERTVAYATQEVTTAPMPVAEIEATPLVDIDSALNSPES